MKTRTKIVLWGLVSFAAFLTCMGAVFLYYFYHPEAVKSFIERSISSSAGADLRISRLDYSLSPLFLKAEGISLEPGRGLKGLGFKMSGVHALMELEGHFGDRTLVIKDMEFRDPRLTVSGPVEIPAGGQNPAAPSLVSSLLRGMAGLFLFKDIRVENAHASGGSIEAAFQDIEIRFRSMEGRLSRDQGLELNGALEAVTHDGRTRLTAPSVSLTAENMPFPPERMMEFFLRAEDAAFHSPASHAEGLEVTSRVKIDMGRNTFSIEGLQIRASGTPELDTTQRPGPGKETWTLRPDREKSGPLLTLDLEAGGRYPLLRLTRVNAGIPEILFNTGNTKGHIRGIRITLHNGSVDLEEGELLLPKIQLSSSLIRGLEISAATEDRGVLVEVQGSDTGLFKAGIILGLLPEGWTFQGKDKISGHLLFRNNGFVSFKTGIEVKGFSFESKDGQSLGQGLHALVEVKGELDTSRKNISGRNSLSVLSGEILHDRFYVDLTKNRFASSAEWTYDMPAKRLSFPDLSVRLAQILSVNLNGLVFFEGSGPRIRVQASVDRAPVKQLFRFFIREPFQNEKPFLKGLSTGGTLSADVKMEGTVDNWVVSGGLSWETGELLARELGLSLKGIDMDLPIWFAESPSPELRRGQGGRLSIESMILPMCPEQGLRIKLLSKANALSIPDPFDIQVPGGVIRLGPTEILNLLEEDPLVETRLLIDIPHIGRLLPDMPGGRVRGSARGLLEPVMFSGGGVSTRGDIEVRAFNGSLLLDDLGADGLFSPAPCFELDAGFKDLSLAELTTGTSFGRVEGVLKGRVEGLEIVYGQPQEFRLLLETVKTEGVKQKISVRAVDNIARIGGGASPFMGLAGVAARFLEDFPYNKIGIRASLENDIFRINGTILENGREYLVKRSGFSGVNVVNQNPENKIRFKDMVKRVRRVVSGSGPVIR